MLAWDDIAVSIFAYKNFSWLQHHLQHVVILTTLVRLGAGLHGLDISDNLSWHRPVVILSNKLLFYKHM